MQENPYDGIAKMMQNEGAKLNPPSIQVGCVVETEPLHIKVDEQDLYADDVLMADYLLEGYKREATLNIEGKITINNGTENTVTLNGLTDITHKSYLKKGDLLAVIPLRGEQQYIVLLKVVSL